MSWRCTLSKKKVFILEHLFSARRTWLNYFHVVVSDAVILAVRRCLLREEIVGGLPEVRRSENLQVLRLPQVGVVASSCPWTVRRAVRREDCEGPQVSPPLENFLRVQGERSLGPPRCWSRPWRSRDLLQLMPACAWSNTQDWHRPS